MNSGYRKSSVVKSTDWLTVALYVALVIIGWFTVCGASFDFAQPDFFDFSTRSGKQMVWILFAFGLAGAIMLFDDRFYEGIASYIYIAVTLLLLITIFVAKDIKGSRSWIELGPVNFQPAEFAKFATALMLGKVMSNYSFNIKRWKYLAQVLAVIFIPMILIVAQKETGSALVFLAFFLMLYREGLPGAVPFMGIAAVVYFVVGIKYGDVLLFGGTTSSGTFHVLLLILLFAVCMTAVYTNKSRPVKWMALTALSVATVSILFASLVMPFNVDYVLWSLAACGLVYLLYLWFYTGARQYLFIALFLAFSCAFLFFSDYLFHSVLQEHQRTRIEVLLGMKDDPAGAGYNVKQSEIAIGSGGLFGKGFLNGTQTKLKYVPEQDTDFIFCTVGEEQGFVGATIVLLLYLAFIIRLVFLSERQNTIFARVYGYCLVSVFLFHLFVNIGMVIGLVPVIGIPLPFFSYGGSSLWGFTILTFIFLRLDAGRDRIL